MQIAFGTILSVVLLHSLLAVGFKEYYFDASLPKKLESENFHELHQQVQDIEHSHVQVEVNTLLNNTKAANETGVQETKKEKLKKDVENKENGVVKGTAEPVDKITVPKITAKIS